MLEMDARTKAIGEWKHYCPECQESEVEEG